MGVARFFEEWEWRALAEGFSGRNALRDRCILLLGVTTGFRIQELLNVRIYHVLDEFGEIREVLDMEARWMKEGVGRSTLIIEELRWVLRDWLLVLGGRGCERRDYKIFDNLGETMVPDVFRKGFWAILKGVAVRSGVDPRGISTHSMRKTFAHRVYCDAERRRRAGEDINPLLVVKEALGHGSLNSTWHYCTWLSREKTGPCIKSIGGELGWLKR